MKKMKKMKNMNIQKCVDSLPNKKNEKKMKTQMKKNEKKNENSKDAYVSTCVLHGATPPVCILSKRHAMPCVECRVGALWAQPWD